MGIIVRLRQQSPSILIGATIVIILVLAAVVGPLLVAHDPNAVNLRNALARPSSEHLLGTDASGRDLLARLLYGGRPSLVGPLIAIATATLSGILIGTLAAWRGGWVDSVIKQVLEIIFAFPGILFAILLVAVLGRGLLAPVVAMAIAFTPFVAQLVRSLSLQEKQKPYIDAYRVLGFSDLKICVLHLFPNIAPVVLAHATINFGYAVAVLGSISFLGFGLEPPSPDWGRMIAEGKNDLLRNAYLPSLVPGIAMSLAVIGFSLLGEGFADRLAHREEQ